MSNVNNFLRDVVLGSVRKVVDDHADDSYAEGFADATKICTAVITKDIDELLASMKLAPYLTDQEQFLLSSLVGIKSEIEKDLREFWEAPQSE